MKFQYTLRTLLLITAVVAVFICIPLGMWMKQRRREIKLWGPNPGRVEYQTVGAGHGAMLVRDVENAEEEVRKEIEHGRKMIEESDLFEVKGEWPPIKFTQLKVTDKGNPW